MALNKRKNKSHVKLLWNIFDRSKTGTITSSDIAAIQNKMNQNVKFDEARRMIKNCSYNGQCITFDEFFQLMTRPDGKRAEDLDYVVLGRVAKSLGRADEGQTRNNMADSIFRPHL